VIVVKIAIAITAAWLIFRMGTSALRAFARPVHVPEPGELRKVNLRYRCSVCGAEVRMTSAADELPDAPRHCMDEMERVALPFDE
jgi:hypothetical protein